MTQLRIVDMAVAAQCYAGDKIARKHTCTHTHVDTRARTHARTHAALDCTSVSFLVSILSCSSAGCHLGKAGVRVHGTSLFFFGGR